MADEAVMDAAVDSSVDTGIESSQPVETGIETQESGLESTPQPGSEETPVAGSTPESAVIDGPGGVRALSESAKQLIEQTKATNPKLAGEIKQALFVADRFRKEFPGGIKDVQALRSTIESLGGQDGIQKVTAELDGWHGFDEKFMAGDPGALEFMLEEPEGQEAFLKLAPLAFDKYAELHPEAWTNYVMRQVEQDAYGAGIPLTILRLEDAIGQDPKAAPLLGAIKQYFERIHTWATTKVVPKGKAAPAGDPAQMSDLDRRTKDLETREEKALRNEYSAGVIAWAAPVFEKEFKTLLNGRTVTDAQRKGIERLFKAEYDQLKAGSQEKLGAFLKAKDQNGYFKYAASEAKKNIPIAMKNAFEAIMPGGKPAPKAAAAPAAARMSAGAQPKADAGFILVSGAPKSADIDWTNMPQGLYASGRALLKGGKKVMWKR